MKINWGAGIVIGMLLFMGFIMFLVITMTTDDKYSHDLVTEEYYERDLYYQNEIDAETNYRELGAQISGKRVEAGWELQFPSVIAEAKVNGRVVLYRPSNQKLDSELPLIMDAEGKMLIPADKLVDGIWKILIFWEQEKVPYLYKETIVY